MKKNIKIIITKFNDILIVSDKKKDNLLNFLDEPDHFFSDKLGLTK